MTVNKLIAGIAASFAVLFVLPAQATTVTVYTDRTAYEAALSLGMQVEDFSGGGVSNSFFSVNSSNDSYLYDTLRDVVDTGAGATTDFGFAGAVNGFGADWNPSGPQGVGSGIALSLGLVSGGIYDVLIEVPNTLFFDFWGIITDDYFTSVTVSAGTQDATGNETYYLDNLTVGKAPISIGNTSVVPLPASLPLMALGVLALAVVRRRT